jgi:hypothetical protein
VLEAVFILLEFSSPSRRIFIGSNSLPPPLSGSPYRSFNPRVQDRGSSRMKFGLYILILGDVPL